MFTLSQQFLYLRNEIKDILQENRIENIPKEFSDDLARQILIGKNGSDETVITKTIQKQFPQSDANKIAKQIYRKARPSLNDFTPNRNINP